MELLLDTHIWLWSFLEPARLSRKVMKVIAGSTNKLWVSPVSTWEIYMLVAKGRLELGTETGKWVAGAIASASFREAPLTHDVIAGMSGVKLQHRDPADWFIAATARNFGLTLVTADARLIEGSGYPVLANK